MPPVSSAHGKRWASSHTEAPRATASWLPPARPSTAARLARPSRHSGRRGVFYMGGYSAETLGFTHPYFRDGRASDVEDAQGMGRTHIRA